MQSEIILATKMEGSDSAGSMVEAAIIVEQRDRSAAEANTRLNPSDSEKGVLLSSLEVQEGKV